MILHVILRFGWTMLLTRFGDDLEKSVFSLKPGRGLGRGIPVGISSCGVWLADGNGKPCDDTQFASWSIAAWRSGESGLGYGNGCWPWVGCAFVVKEHGG